MNNKNIIISLSIYLIFVNVLVAQVSDEIENGIYSSLESKYRTVSIIGRIIEVNHAVTEYQHDMLQITNPYGSLNDCYLFTATVNERGIIGVYKNSILIWDSGPMAYGGYNHRIFGTADLNNDGNVEILAVWDYGMHNPIQNLWIISWYGQNGKVINNKKHFWLPEDQESEIYTFDYLTEIVDVEGDGILEIKGINVEIRNEPKIYSWNGQKYGDYGVTMPDYLPMNLLSANVECKVSDSEYGLLYNYTVTNNSYSQQAIWLFAIERSFERVFLNSGPPNNNWAERYSDNIARWDVSVDYKKYPFDYIYPEDSRTNFKVETNAAIIYIGNFYIQGKNGPKSYDNSFLSENSFSGKTLCGKEAPNPFIATEFLIELINYTAQSYDLGWIEDEKTFNKVIDKLEEAKDQLSNGNTRQTTKLLNDLLKDVEKENGIKLTSEAYALLKYNTRYLLEELENKKDAAD